MLQSAALGVASAESPLPRTKHRLPSSCCTLGLSFEVRYRLVPRPHGLLAVDRKCGMKRELIFSQEGIRGASVEAEWQVSELVFYVP